MHNAKHVNAEIELLIRSKRPIVYIVSQEENRVISALTEMCDNADPSWDLLQWDIVTGLSSSYPCLIPEKESQRQLDQDEILQWFSDLEVPKHKYAVLVVKDYNKFFGSSTHKSQVELRIIRQIKNLSYQFTTQSKTLIILSNSLDIPGELEKFLPVVDYPLPSKEDIQLKISDLLARAANRKQLAEKFQVVYSPEEMDYICNSFRGLTLSECEQTCAYCMIKHSFLSADIISSQKKDIIRKSGLLDWIDPQDSLDSIGGLDGLKNWLHKRKNAFSQDAVDYGLPSSPKGILLAGIQGAGKSLFAKAVSGYWNFPLLRLDMGKIFSGLVGSSENNMRQVFKVAESVAPCILWCDEIDKGMSGTRSSGTTDGGTTSRVLGSWLTWMQERTEPVFVIATANDVSNLPPELLRKGRFDEIFFVDFPNSSERRKIFEIHIEKRNRDIYNFDLSALVNNSQNYTGAEIESSIEAAMYEAFSDNKREITTNDIIKALNDTVPICKLMSEEIAWLRKWASERARNASSNDVKYIAPKNDEDDL